MTGQNRVSGRDYFYVASSGDQMASTGTGTSADPIIPIVQLDGDAASAVSLLGDNASAIAGSATDAADTHTDATAVKWTSIFKQISKSVQLMVFGAGTAAAAQRTTLASDDPAVAALGTTTGAKVVTDANGTLQQYLRGIVTFFANALGAGTAAAAHRTTLASDDPAVAALGAPAGAAVITDANGTLQQYLRGLVKQWIAGTLVIGAGTNLIGKAGIDQTTPGTSDHVTGSGFAVAVGATMQRPADTNAYAVGDIVAQSTTAGSCSGVAIAAARGNDLTGMLRRCRVKVNDAAWLNAQLYVHVFKDTPTFAAGDNAAFAANLTESNYIGAFDVTLDRSFSDPFAKGIGAPRAGSEINFEPHSGAQNLFYVIETRTAVTPGSGKTFTVVFEVLQN